MSVIVLYYTAEPLVHARVRVAEVCLAAVATVTQRTRAEEPVKLVLYTSIQPVIPCYTYTEVTYIAGGTVETCVVLTSVNPRLTQHTSVTNDTTAREPVRRNLNDYQ